MDPQQVQSIDKTRRSADLDRAERERKSRNLWKVYNPTNQDFTVGLNMAIAPEIWTIKAKSEEVVPAYVAEKYFEEMTSRIITTKSDKAVLEENQKRLGKGFPSMDLHTEQARFEGRNLKVLLSKKEQIVKILDRGLYKEYGVGANGNANQYDRRYQKESLDLSEVPVEVTPQATASVAPTPPQVQPEPVVAQAAPQSPLQQPTQPVQNPTQVVEEDDEDEVEEIVNANG